MKRLLALFLLVCGCSKEPSAVPTVVIVGNDGQAYTLVELGKDRGAGSVSEVDLWQVVGKIGTNHTYYTKRLQSANDTSPPIFTKVR